MNVHYIFLYQMVGKYISFFVVVFFFRGGGVRRFFERRNLKNSYTCPYNTHTKLSPVIWFVLN